MPSSEEGNDRRAVALCQGLPGRERHKAIHRGDSVVSKEKPTNISASVRQRLLNLARQRNEEFQLVLIRYGVERLLYRLSVSPYANQFVLKGAMLFQLWTGQPYRSTLDVDLLGSGDDDVDRFVKLFQDVSFHDVPDDGLRFVPHSVIGGLRREEQ